jgi:hypothetical protein
MYVLAEASTRLQNKAEKERKEMLDRIDVLVRLGFRI